MKFFVAFIFVAWLVLAAMSARIFREPIEAELAAQARRALDQRELQAVRVEFDHLDAKLSGNVATREQKQIAEQVVERIAGARVTKNHLTFGADISPRLTLVAGDPIKVSGTLGQHSAAHRLGEGFDLQGVASAQCSQMAWEQPLGAFAKLFFAETTGGRLELDGREVTLEGEVANAAGRWALVDHADGMARDLRVIDQLVVADPVPFEIAAGFEDGKLKFTGRVHDSSLRDRFSAIVAGSDIGALELDSRAVSATWLDAVPAALRLTFDRAVEASFGLDPERINVAATFPNEFWMTAAESSLRAGLPAGVAKEIDFQVARKAVVAEAADGGVEAREPLPIKIMIAGKKMRIEGRVRLKEERDRLLEKLRKARPDLELEADMRYDWREPKIDSLRDVYPEFLAYVISKITDHCSIRLDPYGWEVDAVTRDPHLRHWLDAFAFSSRSLVGVPCEVKLRDSAAAPEGKGATILTQFPIYFKQGSAQISLLQSPKLEALAETLTKIESDKRFTLVGLDRGDGRLALQRARALRRFLVKAGLPFERFELRDERPAGEADWKSERAWVEIRRARSGGGA